MKQRFNKKRILGLLSFLLVCTFASAQDVKFGIRAGLNLPNITAGGTNTPVSEGYSSRLAGGGGLFTEVGLAKNWAIRFGVEYSGQGGKKDGMQAMPSRRLITGMANEMGMSVDAQTMAILTQTAAELPTYYYADIDNTTKFDYVMIPILAQYTWNLGSSPWSLYVNAGPFVSFLVSGKQVSEGTSYMYTDASGQKKIWDDIDPALQLQLQTALPALAETLENPYTFGENNITGEMKSTNFGITGNIGVRYQCGRNFFFLEAGGNYGLITVQQDSQNGTNRLGAGSLMLGYAISWF